MPDVEEPSDLAWSPRTRRAPVVGAVVTLVAAATAVILIAGSAGGSRVKSAEGRKTPVQEEVAALLTGIPQSGNALGSSTAPVTLQFFGDLQCPTARTFALIALPYLIREWVRAGAARIEFRSLRSVSQPEAFEAQQVAALAAGAQDKLWDYVEYFYIEQGQEHTDYVTGSYLRSRAREVPDLNLEQWTEERGNPQLAAQVRQDAQLALATELSGTPSFLIGPTGSTPISSLGESATLKEINDALEQALRSRNPNDT